MKSVVMIAVLVSTLAATDTVEAGQRARRGRLVQCCPTSGCCPTYRNQACGPRQRCPSHCPQPHCCPPVVNGFACEVIPVGNGDQICPYFMWANWGNGYASFYSGYFSEVECDMFGNTTYSSVTYVNYDGPETTDTTSTCPDCNVTSLIRVKKNGRGPGPGHANQERANEKRDQTRPMQQTADPTKSIFPNGVEGELLNSQLVKFKARRGGRPWVFAQLLLFRVRQDTSSPWLILAAGVEVNRVGPPTGYRTIDSDAITIDSTESNYVALYEEGSVSYQIITHTQLKN